MHGMHARLPKNFVLEERLERYADAIELCPHTLAGQWTWACHPLRRDAPDARFDEIRLDVGCGKGAYLCGVAKGNPKVLYVGIDSEPLCIAYTAQHIVEAGLDNALVVPGLGSDIAGFFAPAEVDTITLNFPTPFPRKKEASKRLTSLERLLDYRSILAPGGTVRLKTDSLPLFRFSLEQLRLAGYRVLWQTDDARLDRRDADEPTSEYEERLARQGAQVYAVCATPESKPLANETQGSLSLVDYLPEDLDDMGYVPLGMRGTVTNLRNRRAKAWARTPR